NSMIDRLTLSAKREYTARVEQKNIAMRVLESQINPHFLYNALNLIASLAQLSHQDSIRSVSISLASILRYSIKGGSIVTLEEELSQTSHYINIIKLRFPDRIIIHTNIDSALLPCHVPKLLLQPLLENSCKYATDTAALTVIMEITIRAAGDGMLLTIADNGPGIPPDKLEEIQKRLANYDDNTQLDEEMKSLGLINVHARVRAHFGKPYGLTVASSENGCAVSIALPRVL
ncbi:MAG: histidine kinase, partial [Eubacteriales bacterium]|nr:histidine kinase [Eubacteriales bacterium]